MCFYCLFQCNPSDFFLTWHFRSGTCGSSHWPFLFVYAVGRLAFSVSSCLPPLQFSSLPCSVFSSHFCLSLPDLLAKHFFDRFLVPTLVCSLCGFLCILIYSLPFFHSLLFLFPFLKLTPFKTALHLPGPFLLCLLSHLTAALPTVHCQWTMESSCTIFLTSLSPVASLAVEP